MKKIKLFALLFLSQYAYSQETSHLNDVQDKRNAYFLFVNANVHVDGKTLIENGSILVHNDKIEKVGKNLTKPSSAIVIDLAQKHVYPSFVETFSDYGMPEVKPTKSGSYYEMQLNSQKEGAYNWNQAIKPEVSAANLFKINAKSAEELRKIGFGSVLTHSQDGIVRGTSVLVSLAETKENQAILKSNVVNNFSFDKGTSTQSYPFSLMGAVALLRQTYYDADWYKNGGDAKERNLSLEAFNANSSLPVVFHAKNVLDVLRANKVATEFKTKYIIKTSGNEYQKINEVKNINSAFIVPVNFPKVIDVEDPIDAESVTLTELKHWELAPYNLKRLAENQILFAITSSDLKDKSTFLTNVQKSVNVGGLDKALALDALTSVPAKLFKIDNQVGSIKEGLLANLLITSGDIFETNTKIIENWVQGNRYVINDVDLATIKGNYKFNINNEKVGTITFGGENDKPTIDIIQNDSLKLKATIIRDKQFVTITYKKGGGAYRLSGIMNGKNLSGVGKDDQAQEFSWNAEYIGENTIVSKKDTSKITTPSIGSIIYPFTAFGNLQKPQKENLLIKNATVWTNENEGTIKTDVLVVDGKISSVGLNLPEANAKVIDAKGKHLTNGIFDEHSHIALFSINEIESVSSQVRQEDALNSEDINIYRQLAGGVTTSQLLHGSADCIGGQSVLIKLKWGESPENLMIPNAPKFIKFALGENVKRGNSPQRPNRYPSTRMGVEQVFQDAFTRAKAYQASWNTYNAAKIKTGLSMPRRDLKLDALVEILENKRNITCHSYVQSEINMLMKLSDSLGFKINTFTHILEGYKVADKMKARGINASTFSDWWAYKMEVKEAIPQNAAILTKVGVNTAINSDDAEMARRLNQEAAKTVLYGGLTEEEAWKTVTLNPAKMCHLDDRLGSIKKGKDADLVIWSDNPLSVYASPEKTIIDGAIYFDVEKEKLKKQEMESEKNRIIQKLLQEKSKGAATVKPTLPAKSTDVHCDSLLELGGMSVELYESQN